MEWNDLSSRIFDESHGKIQVEETRKAFYAGAASMFVMLDAAGDLPTDEAVMECIGSLNSELVEHLEGLKREAHASITHEGN